MSTIGTGFVRAKDGRVRLMLDAQEATVLAALVEQLVSLLGGEDEEPPAGGGELPAIGISENTTVPDDPVLARLFPDAYEGAGAAAAEFRRYTEVGLRDGKIAAATAVLDDLGSGGEVLLDTEQAQAWLRALNDLRLALGTRLEITEDAHERLAGLDSDDPRYPAYAAYDWLSFLQESLVRALW